MILGGTGRNAEGAHTTLDDLFRRAGVRHPDMLALADPPNRESFTDGAPRNLTYAHTDRAISALVSRLHRLGLQADTVVAMQLPNTVESVITLLALLRAGMIAVPLPLLWRQAEIVAALKIVGAKAIVTSSRIGANAHVETAMRAAVELFPIRHICAFGQELPDGVVPLDDIFAPEQSDFLQPSARPGTAACHAALVTIDVGTDGLRAMARNHNELIAGGLAPYLEGGAAQDASVLSTIPLGSFAGVALSVVPWLLGGGTLNLHHAFDPETFAQQCRMQDGGIIVLPGSALAPLVEAGHVGGPNNTVVALWRSPERLASSQPWPGEASVVDVASFGETGLIAGLRGADGLPLPISYGAIGAPRSATGAVNVVDVLRTAAGTLALRGPIVPTHAFPPGAEHGPEPHLAVDALGFVDTRFTCRLERDTQMLVIDSPPAGVTAIGGYRFRQNAIDWLVAEADLDATIVALPDAFLNLRLAGSGPDLAATAAQLKASGVNPLISGAFQPRNAA